MHVHWHRRDLRVADNRGLAVPDLSPPVLPVFVLDEGLLQHAAPPRVAFLLDALESLRTAYRARGSDLLVRRGDPAEVLPELAAGRAAEAVTACADYSGLARRRDERVAGRLDEEGVAFETVQDALLVPPGEITSSAGNPYAVFSYYADKWHDRPADEPADEPDDGALADAAGEPIPTRSELGFDEPEADVPPAGTGAARERLAAFLDGPVYEYADRRDYPAAECTSRLSPHLKFGTIGIREVYEATERAADGTARESVREFQEQLAWRDFYAEQLSNRPDMVGTNLEDFERPIEWRRDEEDFAAWKEGRTGYPIVDAGMRQLRAEAWMHNRVRMIVASFLTKDLRLDWRWGYDWFREKLVDHDPASDAGGWQWAASTGTDAQPFFRVFNPTTQGERYDPDAAYVREYVPELREVPPETVHAWTELSESERASRAPAYPSPIVDHAAAREAALAMYRRARGE